MDHLLFISCACHAFTSVYCCSVVGLTAWLLNVMIDFVFVTFPCGILGQAWYLIVSFPDLCHHSYLDTFYWPNMCPGCCRC